MFKTLVQPLNSNNFKGFLLQAIWQQHLPKNRKAPGEPQWAPGLLANLTKPEFS